MILGLIPARGGSKRVPGKNMRPLGGVPLLGWTIVSALRSECIDAVVVSSDDDAILKYADESGVAPLKRPAEYATDDASSYLAMTHALEHYPAEAICLLQPTSPFRQPADIEGCHKTAIAMAAPAAVTVEAGKTVPNGAVYLAKSAWLLERLAAGETAPFDSPEPAWHIMPAERSIDIDTEADFAEAVRMLAEAA